MQKLKWIKFLLLILIVFGCSNTASELESLKKSVMDAHDEVMPKMGVLRKTANELSEKSLGSPDSISLAQTSALIQEANENMMIWMRSFEPDFGETESEKLDYLKDQLVKVQKVRDDMNSSLEKGKKLLSQ